MPIHTDAHARMLREPRSSSIVAAADRLAAELRPSRRRIALSFDALWIVEAKPIL